MLWRCFLAMTLAILGARTAACAEFPYIAYINSDDVYVRSGPGRNYYPTDKLAKGGKVEVYRHDPGGWYAIRPPAQSFSWVSSRHLVLADAGLAKVNAPRVVARVGSAFSEVRDVIQVRLDRGEIVELVDAPAPDSPWCKISPPSGEFRWVFSKYIDHEPQVDDDKQDRRAEGPGTDLGSRDEDPGARAIRLASSQQAVDTPAASIETRGTSATKYPSEFSGEADLAREMDRIDFELSTIVAEDITVWSFGDLRQRADAAMNAAKTPVERGRAHALLTKLARFDDIKQRHAALHQGPEQTDRSTGRTALASPRRADDARFDGMGRLSPVISQKTGGPTYALVDDSNAVMSFVTPAPGVNLRPYVDHYVGVNGQRGYMTDLQRQHISVQRVTVLDTQRR